MDKERQLQQLLLNFGKKDVFIPAKVISVSGNICKVDIDGLSVSDVRLSATTENKEDQLLITPKIGTNVLVGSLTGDCSNLFIAQMDESQQIDCKMGESSIKVTDKGFEFNRQGENLKTVLNDMIDELNKIIVIQGTTINVVAMTEIKQRLNKILI